MIRVQRDTETLLDAAERLHKAGQNKQPATLVLIVTQSQGAIRVVKFVALRRDSSQLDRRGVERTARLPSGVSAFRPH